MTYGSWDIKRDKQNFLSLCAIFCPNHPENRNFEKNEKNSRRYHLYMSIINENHMMYDSWDMECDRQNFFSFWTIFCSFTSPLNNPKSQNFEKMKHIPRDIIILHKCTINDNHVIYGSCDINCNRQIFLSS